MSRIPQSFIHDLIARADLLDVIGARVALKKAGSNYKGLCPFHNEKTPSFSVSPEKGFYHCFGCDAHGNAIDFLMRYENRSFPEAVEALADMLHLEVPVERADEGEDELTGLFAVLGEADQIFRRALREHEHAIEYLKRRGIEGATAARYAIGYAPDAWDTLVRSLGGTPAALEKLLAAGLAVENERGRRYDRFRNRIMFPIRDPRGRVIGFGGRVLGNEEPKYLNSPETPVFHKGRALYGVYEARQRPGRPDRIVVVEGYMDVVALAQHGIEPVVATLGTATTAEHVRQLTRLADRVVFCFDGDRAGRAAAWRAAETALPLAGGSIELKFLLLPEGEDPDSQVRGEGSDAFAGRLDGALSLSSFLVHALREQVDLGSADGRAKLVTLARPLLGRLPEGVYRELLIGELAAAVGLEVERFQTLLEGHASASQARPTGRRVASELNRTLMRKIITLILHYPAVAGGLARVDGLDSVDLPGADLLRRLLEITARDPQVMPAQLIETFRSDPEGRYLARLAAESPLDDEQAASAVLGDSLEKLVADERKRAAGRAVRQRAKRPEPPTERSDRNPEM